MSIDTRRLAIAIAGASAFANLYTTQPLLPVLAAEFGGSPAHAGLTVTGGTLSVALVAPVAGLLADGWGRKRIIVAAMLLVTIPTLLAAFSGSLGDLIFWRLVQGVCLPFIFAVTVAYVGEEFEPREAAAVTGIYVAGTIIGGFLGRLLAGFVAEAWGWRMVFPALAGLDVLMALAVAVWLPRETRFVRSANMRATLRAMAAHVKNPRLLSAFAAGFSMLFVLVSTFTYVNFVLADAPYRLNSAALGAVFVVYLAGSAASPVAGRLVGQLGHRPVMTIGVALAVTGLSLTLFSNLAVIIGGLAIATTGIFTCQSVATGFVASSTASARTAAVGLYVCAYYLGGSFGAVAPAPAWSAVGWPGVVALSVAVELVILALVWRFWRPVSSGA